MEGKMPSRLTSSLSLRSKFHHISSATHLISSSQDKCSLKEIPPTSNPPINNLSKIRNSLRNVFCRKKVKKIENIMHMMRSKKIGQSTVSQVVETQKARKQLIIESQGKGLVKTSQKEIKDSHRLSQFKPNSTPPQER